MNYIIIFFLVLLSIVFSGSIIVLFSLDIAGIKRQVGLGNINAKRVFEIRNKGNRLLCTLLIGNVTVNSTLSIFLGTIASGLFAGLFATSLILVFGEILPATFFTRHALYVGAKLSPIIKIFLIIFFPIAYPLSYVLDKYLGEELPTIWGKDELSLIIKDHQKSRKSKVDEDDARIAIGALKYSEKTVNQIMTPLINIFSLYGNQKVDRNSLTQILNSNFSKIPILSTSNEFIGVLEIKELNNFKINNSIKRLFGVSKTFSELKLYKNTPIFSSHDKLDDCLKRLIEIHFSMAIVIENKKVIGLITTEDILEEIVQKNIDA